jgi:nucleoside-diphosphate-sugar epimerase
VFAKIPILHIISSMSNLSEVNSLLITGANGFVGRSIIDQISMLSDEDLPQELLLVTRQGLDFDLPVNLRTVSKVLSQDLTQKWNFDNNVSHIINLAADGSKTSYSTEANDTFSSIVTNLISWVSTNQKAPRVFHASSGACSEYKPISGMKNLSNPKSDFAQNRLKAERDLQRASEDFNFELSIGRLYAFSGIHLLRKSQYAISNFIKSGISTKVVKVTGDPNTVRSYLHQDDMANWILAALVAKEPQINLEIGSNDAVTIKELAEFVAQETSAQLSFAAEPPPGDIYLPNNQATRDKLGVTECKSWKLAVSEMIGVERKSDYVNF